MTNLFANKTALITGSTSGLGRALALTMAEQGAHIIALGRTVGALEELDDDIKKAGGQTTLVPLDLTELETIDPLGPTLFQRFDKLDYFIAGAAYLGGLAPITHYKTAEWDKVITTNLIANFALIRTLHPLLERAENGTACFISDNSPDNRGTAYWGPYSASKAALETLVQSYAAECQTTSIKALTLIPGPMPTPLRRKAYPGEDTSHLAGPAAAAQKITELLRKNHYENGDQIKL